jgi:hypothetical protein
MATVERLIADWTLERASLLRQLELLESGQLRPGIPMGSTTGATIVRVKNWITNLDDLLNRYGKKPAI